MQFCSGNWNCLIRESKSISFSRKTLRSPAQRIRRAWEELPVPRKCNRICLFVRAISERLKLKRYVSRVGTALRNGLEPAFFEYFQHRSVVGQNFGGKFVEPAITCNRGEMAQECCADPLPLVFIDHGKGDFRHAGLLHDVASTRDNHGAAFLFEHSDEGHVIDEVDEHKIVDFFLGKIPFRAEETPVHRLCANATDGSYKIRLILRPESADFDAAPIP